MRTCTESINVPFPNALLSALPHHSGILYSRFKQACTTSENEDRDRCYWDAMKKYLR